MLSMALGYARMIELFKSDNNIDCDSLTFEELQNIVNKNKELNRKYTSELRSIGIKI